SSTFNVLLPSHPLSSFLKNRLVSRTATRPFEPYERLTGISQERPAVLMLTQFLPLFDGKTSQSGHRHTRAMESSGVRLNMTDVGRYVDMQINSSNLRAVNAVKSILKLSISDIHIKN